LTTQEPNAAGPEPRPAAARFIFLLNCVYVAALTAVLVCGTAYSVEQLARHNVLVPADKNGTPIDMVDFLHFYQAGQLVIDPATRDRVYDPEIQLAWQRAYLKPGSIDKAFYIQYMPFVFPLMVPIGLLPAEAAFLLWTALSLIAGLVGILLLNSLVRRSYRQLAAFAIAMLVSLPTFVGFLKGQLALALFLIFSIYWWGLRTGRDFPAGIALCLSTVKPHYTLFVFVPALLERRWKLLAVAACFEVALLGLAGFTIGWANVVNYPAILMSIEASKSVIGVNPAKQVCLRAVLNQFMLPEPALRLSMAIMIVGWIGAFLLWRQALRWQANGRPDSDRALSWCMALTVLICLVVSPHTHLYDWTSLALVAWLTLPALSLSALAEEGPLALRIWTGILLLYPLLSWLAFLGGAALRTDVPWATLSQLLLHLVLLVSGAIYWLALWRRRRLETIH